MKQHFLQSEVWEGFQRALGHETIRRGGEGWSYLAVIERGHGLSRLYCPYGPTAASLEALDMALASLETEAKRVGAVFMRVQPYPVMLRDDDAKMRKMQAVPYSQPVATRVIDLTPSLNEIIAGVSQSKRSIIRNYEKKGLRYRQSYEPSDVEKLLPLLHDIAQRNHISVHDDEYIRTQARSLMPEHASVHFMELDGHPVTGALLFEDNDTAYYAHAGTAAQHYKLQANTALLGELLAYAKHKGKTTFDLYGIAPPDVPDHPWAGISEFKASFGGDIIRYNPTFDIPLKKGAYYLYETLRKGLKKLKK